jgi:PAS domain S-box-containing protein
MRENRLSWMRVTILGMLVVACAGLWVTKNTLEFQEQTVQKTNQHLLSLAKTESQKIEQLLIGIQGELEMLSLNPLVAKYQKDGFSDKEAEEQDGYTPGKIVFQHIGEHFPIGIDSFYRISEKGLVLARFPFKEGKVGNNYSEKPGVKAVLESHEPYISDVFTTGSGVQAISICQPVFGEEEFVGLLRALVYVDTLCMMVCEDMAEDKGHAWIVDENGIVIAHPNPIYRGKGMVEVNEETFPDFDWSEMKSIVERMARGEGGVSVYHCARLTHGVAEVEKELIAFTPLKMGTKTWSVAVSMKYDEIAGPISRNARTNFLVAVGSCLLFGLGLIMFHRAQEKKAELEMVSRSAEELRIFNEKLQIEIDQRKSAEEATRQSERRFRLLIETAGSVILVLSPDHRIVEFNRQAELVYGVSRNDVLGKDYFELFLPKEIHEDLGANIQTVLGGQAISDFENSIITDSGTRLDFLWNATRLLNAEDEPIGVLCIGQDITKRKRAEQTLKLTQFTIDHITDSVFWIGPDARLLRVNDGACQNLGYSREELLSMTVHDVDPNFPAERWPSHWEELKEKGSIRFDTEHRTKDGKIFPVGIAINYVEFLGKEYNFAIARDITERRRMEEERLEKEKLQGVIEMAGATCHELNQPLQVVSGHSEILLREASKDRRLYERTRTIKQQVDRMAEITRKLQNITKYVTREYIKGTKIIDIEEASKKT